MSPFLNIIISITLCAYGIAILLGLWRAIIGPTAQDRVLALDYVTTVGMLAVLVISISYSNDVYFEGALILALFGFVSSAAIAKFLLRGEVIE
ncbi:MAG: K+/H+ antiporter subunit F [Burkholderiaceae bacterium]|jgi:multicomponent K+:H+ antiporter subunit F|nr:K+/H+ antiporter subunit F [Burkholderiaceae bacterium]